MVARSSVSNNYGVREKEVWARVGNVLCLQGEIDTKESLLISFYLSNSWFMGVYTKRLLSSHF